MNDNHSDLSNREKQFICHCSGTTKEQIVALIHDGVDNLECLARATGASLGCGACETEILELLEELH